MIISKKILNNFIKVDLPTNEIINRMIDSGSNVENSISFATDLSNVVVGKIISIEKHEDADKLQVTKINVGSEIVQIVTGATNISLNDYVPVALNGAKLANGLKIKKSKLRGVESNGMLCSLSELGFDDNVIPKEFKDGIYILDNSFKPGDDLLELVRDELIEYELTFNRPDCRCYLGMAREYKATFDISLNKDSEKKLFTNSSSETNNNEVTIINNIPELVSEYHMKVIENVNVKRSPVWLELELMKMGQKPINNIVDATNYIMKLYGLPLHAFDLDKLTEKVINIKKADEHQEFVTLDNVTRKLSSDDIIITDNNSTIAIAGIMGGLDSEVTNSTKNIAIEAAVFDKDSIRATSKRLNLRTDASTLFEKEVDYNLPLISLDNVCSLISNLCNCSVSEKISSYSTKVNSNIINVRIEKINRHLGTDISKKDIINYLEKLEFIIDDKGNSLNVTIPSFRSGDITTEYCIIEEVARLYGYNNIKSTLPKTIAKDITPNILNFNDKVSRILTYSGLNQILTYSFVNPNTLDTINTPKHSILRKIVHINNPLGEEFSAMRTTLLPSFLDVIKFNTNRNNNSFKGYEIANTFTENSSCKCNNIPVEEEKLIIGMSSKKYNFFDLKGVLENLFKLLNIDNVEYIQEENNHTYHTGKCAAIFKDDIYLGTMGEIHPSIQKNYGLKERVYIADIKITELFNLYNEEIIYTPIKVMPSIKKDLALVVDKSVLSAELVKCMKSVNSSILSNIDVFDVYEGDQVPEGKKSIAYRLEFYANERTLTDEEVNVVLEKILKKLETDKDAILRS